VNDKARAAGTAAAPKVRDLPRLIHAALARSRRFAELPHFLYASFNQSHRPGRPRRPKQIPLLSTQLLFANYSAAWPAYFPVSALNLSLYLPTASL
jgi:hypothetical protein